MRDFCFSKHRASTQTYCSLLVFWGLDEVDAVVKPFLEDGEARIVFVEPFLVLGDFLVLFVGVDDLGADEDDEVGLLGLAVVFAEEGADDGKATEAGDARARLGLLVTDHSAERDEIITWDLDAGLHVGVARRDPG